MRRNNLSKNLSRIAQDKLDAEKLIFICAGLGLVLAAVLGALS